MIQKRGQTAKKETRKREAGRVFLLSKKKVATTTRKWAAVNPDLPEICSQKRLLVSEEDADEKAKKLKAGKKEEKGVENHRAAEDLESGAKVRGAEQDRNINIK